MIRRWAEICVLVALAGAFAGCVSFGHTVEVRPDGVIHIKCDEKLQLCLNEVENRCNHQRYVVLRAVDTLDQRGVNVGRTDVSSGETHTSEAWFRCTGFGAWGEANRDLLKTDVCAASEDDEPRDSLHAPPPRRSPAAREAAPAPVAPPPSETPPTPPEPPAP